MAKPAKVEKKASGKAAAPSAAKTAAKPAAKATTKPAKSKPAAKPAAKPTAAKAPAKSAPKAAAPKADAKQTKAPPEAAPAAPAVAAPVDDKAPKPITVSKPVSKPGRRAKPPVPQMPKYGEPLLKPGAPAPKPLIASGPKAAPAHAPLGPNTGKPIKSPLDKKQVEQFRLILLSKRAELVGDVNTMENEALMSQSGALSHLPQHMAEQGSDAYGQSLSLDLAAADRRLIKEIDEALLRIQEGVYGICELTGKPIKLERLHELPWARYSIEAARELERRGNTQ